MQELVSIIMPTYNCAAFIGESVQSVLMQHYTNWELIIVDDCSTDNTKSVLAPYLAKYPNIHYTCLKQNSGPAVTRSEALKQAKGDYVAFLDSDDRWTPNKLSLQIDFMKQNKVAFSATGYELISDDGTSKGVALIPPQKTDYHKMLRLSCPIGNSTVMFDRRKIGDIQVPSIKKHNDFALWLKILHQVNACYGVPDILTLRREQTQHAKWQILSRWHLYRDVEHLGLLKGSWYTLCYMFVKITGLGSYEVDLKNPKRELADSVLYYE